ncbi:CHAT domain-containing protein [Sphingopyxis sp.]|uniref:CHAT domain-containing protein n=1 Tax=Sphingopyxis sp. TaxID=1908224 RepID=UPI002D780B6A|nr:CHAT domain-containing protein [Sphingopyxis sp.]HET6523173.1 CHAT domain-containing protein [Sphingopyxis sp.]
MKILYIAGNPADAPSLQIQNEIQLLQHELNRVPTSESLELMVHPDLQFDQLVGVLGQFKPGILHLSAHGRDDAILFAQREKGHVVLDARRLGQILTALKLRPRLIILNACRSETMAGELAEFADFVIGTDAPITNVGARQFAGTLYNRLANGDTLADAYTTASAVLGTFDDDQVRSKLFSSGGEDRAAATWLVDRFRIVARFPLIDRWLQHQYREPRDGFEEHYPEVQFGVAGVPAASRLTQILTDDDEIKISKKESLADARGWMTADEPSGGEIWFEPVYRYYGDMRWYASTIPAKLRIDTATATTVAALTRYYFMECWQGKLPPAMAMLIREAVLNLERNNGSRRLAGAAAATPSTHRNGR